MKSNEWGTLLIEIYTLLILRYVIKLGNHTNELLTLSFIDHASIFAEESSRLK